MEEAGVDASRRLFRSQGWIYQEVDQENDYGKDAYIDLPETGTVTGITFALQVKSGSSYRRANGYRIPVEDHRVAWMESSVPVFGVVYDKELDRLFWVNITQYLRDRVGTQIRQIVVSAVNVLDTQTIESDFRQAVYRAWNITQGAVFLLNFFGNTEEIQRAAVLDCRSLGESEPRFIILLRASLRDLIGDGLRTALWVLGHFVPSRRLWLEHMTWTRSAREDLQRRMHLDPIEIAYILGQMGDEDWQVEQSVNELLWLIIDDPDGLLKLKQALEIALVRQQEQIAVDILEIICFLAGDVGLNRYHEVADTFPAVKRLTGASDLQKCLEEHGNLYLFSFVMDSILQTAGSISRDWKSTILTSKQS
jgi:hypothetical protein